ncbi:MAG: hypothetical protein DMG36_19775 [Acidobacteria bacterium]|nr:MAG: hypothetical protein DMG36_19775 [Acidobacteriota bacterium]
MNENSYLQQVGAFAGLQYYPNQGPWGRKSGAAMGPRDGYVAVIGFMRDQRSMKVAILLRFKKLEQTEAVKTALKSAGIKKGKLGAVGADFVRWEWTYSFTKPKAEDVAKLVEDLGTAIKPVTLGFDGRCEDCTSASTPSLTLMNGVPTYICAGCQEKVRQELNMAATNYDAITPNYPNGLVLGIAAAALGGLAWGLLAYAINYIFLYGAILIGYLVAAAVLKGTGKVTRFGQVIIPVLTVASVLFGDAIFFTLFVMKQEHVSFSGKLLNTIVAHLWEIEREGNGVATLIFALVGAGYAVYSARKPKFQAVFQPLGSPNA